MTNLHHKRKVNRECVTRWNDNRKEAGWKRKAFWLSPETQENFDKAKKAFGKTNDELFAEAMKIVCKRWNIK